MGLFFTLTDAFSFMLEIKKKHFLNALFKFWSVDAVLLCEWKALIYGMKCLQDLRIKIKWF